MIWSNRAGPMFQDATARMRMWVVGLFAAAVRNATRHDDRVLAIEWLSKSRAIVAGTARPTVKFQQLNALISSRTAFRAIGGSVAEGFTNYKRSDLPLSVKVAIPATLAALPLLGGQAAGVAAFGSAIGVPVLLLIFLGVSGITAVIEAVIKDPAARAEVAKIIDVILEDERLRETKVGLRAAMKDRPIDPCRFEVPSDEVALRQHLSRMDPFDFERHAMSFYQRSGMIAWTTPRSNDFGMDGAAVHDNGLIIVQCKRNAIDNRVGRPTVQQFKGVVEEQGAYRGYIITSSFFTQEAVTSAGMSDKIRLIDIDELVEWHQHPPRF
jgi:restriction system protein